MISHNDSHNKETEIKENENTNNKDEEKTDMNVIINNQEYEVQLEKNETVDALLKMLPLEMNMTELNGNEKYYYFNQTLPTNAKVPDQIEKGDIMLYGNNCLVIFYKSFQTNYSYTKIGHIDELPELGYNNVTVKIK